MHKRLISWFQQLRETQRRASSVLSINNRNLGFVYPNNKRVHFPLANDKLLCKQVLQQADVKVPLTHYAYGAFYELAWLEADLEKLDSFVIKPANGSAGNGIIVILGKAEQGWLSAGGKVYALSELKKHISDIIFGVYSHDMADKAMVEQRIVQHAFFNHLSEQGLADVRVILYKDRPVMAMSRIPTRASEGKANLHQGAIGLGVDVSSGQSSHAIKDGESIIRHPDTRELLLDLQLPFWDEVLQMAVKAASAVPLKYLGVDIAITEQGPLMIEINARPGIEIQNANNRAMRELLMEG